MGVCVCVWLCMCMCLWLYVCVCVGLWACVCVCGEMEHYARSCKRRANPNQGHKTKGESLHSRGEKVKESDDLIQGMDFIKET